MGDLNGKVAIVTGSASGIGEASVRALAAAGAKVVVTAQHEDRAKAVADSITATGAEAMGVGFDTSDEEQVKRGIDAIVARFGGIDILHNNAALTNPQVMMQDGMIHQLDTGLWDQTMAVNVRGYMLCTKHVLPHMLARGGGVVINTASGAGMQGEATRPAYGTSKAAVIGFTRSIATQYGKMGVRAVTVMPGLTMTSTVATNVPAPMLEMMKRHHLTTDLPGPDAVANAIVFLASDKAAYITGAVIPVDGGFSVHGPSYADDMAMFAVFSGAQAKATSETFRRALEARTRSGSAEGDAGALAMALAGNAVWHGAAGPGAAAAYGLEEITRRWGSGPGGARVGEVVYADGTHVVGVLEYPGGSGAPIKQAHIFHLNERGQATEIWSLPSSAVVERAVTSGSPVEEHSNVARFREAEEARARNTFGPEDLAKIEQFLRDDVHWNSPWGAGPSNREQVVQQFGSFNQATGGTMELTLYDVFADDTHALSLVRLKAGRPDRPGQVMDVREANVFHLDSEGRAYEFWGVAEDQPAINAFWS